MANKRYEELNHKIKEWHKNGEQDQLILQTLYSQCNLEHSPLLKGVPNIQNKTHFNDLTDEELVSKFAKEPFNNYSQTDLNHLMQEVHNRYIKENGFDVTRSVYVKERNPEDQGVFGYCCYADDLLFINKDMIDEAKAINGNTEPINAATVGKYFLDTIWHETKHIIQYEDGIDLALGKKQDKETAFSAAAMMVSMTNFSVAQKKNDWNYAQTWRAMYRFHFWEHEANYAALKKSEDNTEESLKSNYDYQMYASDSAALALGFRPSTTDDEKNKADVQARVLRMEGYMKKLVDYFMAGTTDCPIREKVKKITDEYMKVDKNGNSPFRERMTKEVNEMVETYVVNKRKMDEHDLKHGKKNNLKVNKEDNDEYLFSLVR